MNPLQFQLAFLMASGCLSCRLLGSMPSGVLRLQDTLAGSDRSFQPFAAVDNSDILNLDSLLKSLSPEEIKEQKLTSPALIDLAGIACQRSSIKLLGWMMGHDPHGLLGSGAIFGGDALVVASFPQAPPSNQART